MEPIEEYEHEGIKIKIFQDDDCLASRGLDYDRVGEFWIWSRGYELGDRGDLPENDSIDCPKCGGHDGRHPGYIVNAEVIIEP
jgi:hypothetical protein